MSDTLGGQSLFTRQSTLFTYYLLCLLSYFMDGIPFLLVLIAALYSTHQACKESAPVVEAHSRWIVRSIWISCVLAFGAILAALAVFSLSGVEVPAAVPDYNSFGEFWNDPAMRILSSYALVLVGVVALVGFWFIYRMVRGVYALAYGLPPTKS